MIESGVFEGLLSVKNDSHGISEIRIGSYVLIRGQEATTKVDLPEIAIKAGDKGVVERLYPPTGIHSCYFAGVRFPGQFFFNFLDMDQIEPIDFVHDITSGPVKLLPKRDRRNIDRQPEAAPSLKFERI